MEKFVDKNFYNSGDHLRYMYLGNDFFVARFRYSKSPIRRTHLKKMLTKYYDVNEYFHRMNNREAPLEILMNDGHLVFDYENRQFILDGKVL